MNKERKNIEREHTRSVKFYKRVVHMFAERRRVDSAAKARQFELCLTHQYAFRYASHMFCFTKVNITHCASSTIGFCRLGSGEKGVDGRTKQKPFKKKVKSRKREKY